LVGIRQFVVYGRLVCSAHWMCIRGVRIADMQDFFGRYGLAADQM